MSGSVTNWLTAYRDGDRQAAQELWNRYYKQLVSIARARLQNKDQCLQDEEDIALSAFNNFFRGIEAGRYPSICDRDGLWRLLVHITADKVVDAHRWQGRAKRSAASASPTAESKTRLTLNNAVSDDPSPEFCAMAAETLCQLFGLLGGGQLQEIAVFRMEGYSREEIAEKLGCSLTTIDRKLKRIRHEWSQCLDE